MTELILEDGRLAPHARLIPRIAIGAAQGLSLWALLHFKLTESAPIIFGMLVLALSFAPTLVIGALGQMRLGPLVIWAAIAAALLAVLGGYDAWREMGWGYPGRSGADQTGPLMEITPLLWFAAPIALYVAHHLVAGADRDRKPIANYETYFDIGWTSAVQIALAGAFTLALWLILWLGAALFDMIGLKLLSDLLGKGWFSGPLLGAAFAAAVHVSDVRQGLARGMRTLALTLLGWLAPVLAGLTALFLIALPFTGFGGLWDTKAAAAILLAAAIILTALTNAAYQDGGADKATGKLFQASSILTALALPALVGLAGYALVQRIGQYGLTPERIFAAACVAVAAVYALGYLATLVAQWRSRRIMEATNILGAGAILAAFVALFSPLADPARLAADDQTARLVAGKIAPDKFDFWFLAQASGRFGRSHLDRLAALKDGANAADIARIATSVKANKYADAAMVTAKASLKDRLSIYPAGAALPKWIDTSTSNLDDCLSNVNKRCNVYLVDLTGDGEAEVIFDTVAWDNADGPPTAMNFNATMLSFAHRQADGEVVTGSIGPLCNAAQREALKSGTATSAPRGGFDLVAAGLTMKTILYAGDQKCPS